MKSLSYYSYLLFGIILLTVATAAAIWYEMGTMGAMTVLLTLAALVLYWVVARRGVPSPANPEKRIRKARASGRPVVVYFYSDWSLICLLSRPFSAKAEREYRGRCELIYIRGSHPDAAAAARSIGGAGVGDFVLFDASGNLVERANVLAGARLESLLTAAQ